VGKIPGHLKFNEDGLIPAIAQDAEGGQVLMVAYMNEEALRKTLESGFAHYYSRSRGRLWKKGEESGHLQRVKEIRLDCDGDALLLQVEQEVAACHLGYRSCFFRRVGKSLQPSPPVARQAFEPKVVYGSSSKVLEEVYQTIRDRKKNRPQGSYVASLLTRGRNHILKKIGEETSELLLAAKGGRRAEIVYELTDLWFHCLVLLGLLDIPLRQVWEELQGRMGKKKGDYPSKRGRRPKKSKKKH
jgi:phosphoribosyl-ATP pyrophosphohydrolase/phosphoribosyl-AMP cyclohydrolase